MDADEQVTLLDDTSSESDNDEVSSTHTEAFPNPLPSRGRLKHGIKSSNNDLFFSHSSLTSPIKHRRRKQPILTRYFSSPEFICKVLKLEPKLRLLTKKCSLTRSVDRQTGTIANNSGQRQPSKRNLLFRNATDLALFRLKGVTFGFKKDNMTKGNLSNGQESVFSQAVALGDETAFGQHIELSTLKFADSPSVDEELAEWLLSSGQSRSPSGTGSNQNPPPFDVSVSLTDGPSSFESEKSIQNDQTNLKTISLMNGDPRSHLDDMEIIQDVSNYNPMITMPPGDKDVYAENVHMDDNFDQAMYCHQQPEIILPDMDQIQQPISLMGERRLPDVVAIDQCYRENEENECSTLCLMANFNSLKKDESASQDPQQANSAQKRGVQDRKERTSLRRGVMMRQMSINPDVHPELNLISEMKASEQPNDKTQETAAVNNNNNLIIGKGPGRKCSFSKSIIPPTVVVEESAPLNDGGPDTDKTRRSSFSTYQHNTASSRPKMKHLSQNSSSPSAMRFRLTFDEASDAAANTVIGLPDTVAPRDFIGGKRPSCICGEPELPREIISESESNSSLLRSDQYPLIGRPSVSPICENIHNGGPPSLAECMTPVDLPQTLTSDGLRTVAGVNKTIPSDFCHSESMLNTSLPHIQSSQCPPRITIRVSNSNQSFTPLLSDSPISMDGSTYDMCDGHDQSFHVDKDGSFRENSVSPYPYAYHSHPDSLRDYINDPSNPSESTQLLSEQFHAPHLMHQTETAQAPPIQDLYRYHVFFSHCAEDRDWVEHMVAHLESPPFNYTCAYTSIQDEVDQGTLQQRILCAAMLSERVVLVLSGRYVQDTWFSFEKTLKQLTQMSLHNQRIMGVLLEDCVIPDSLGELYFLDASDPDFFHVFTKRLKTSRIPRSSASVSSDLGQSAVASPNVTNGKVLTFCRLQVKVGWDTYLVPTDDQDMDIPPSLTAHGIGMEKTEFGEIVTKVSGIVDGTNQMPWLLSARPMVALLLAGGLWIPAFIAVLVIHVDDDSGIALPIRLGVFLYPLGLVAAGYLIKWRRAYWLTKIVRLLVQNCIDVNQALYFQGRPLFTTAAHVRANIFAVYFVYFDATDCVRSVDLLLITCMEDDWDKLLRLISFYTRDENYLSRMSISERLTVMMSAPYLVKLVRQVLPHPPQQRHVSRLLCLCQFTEECISRFAHGFDREDVPGLAELFTRHLPGKVSGCAVRRVQEELFHANHGLVP